MSFQETYDAFWDSHMSDAVGLFNQFSEMPAISEKGEYTLSGSVATGVNFNVALSADSTVVNKGLDTSSTIGIKGNITQPGIDDVIGLDANMLYTMTSGASYLNIQKFNLTSEKGNPQVSMIAAFSAILTNKWISLASSGLGTTSVQGLSLSNLYKLPSVLVASLKKNPIFVEKSKEEIDGNPVYHVALSADGLYMVAKDITNDETIKAFLRGTTFTDEELRTWADTFAANAAFDGQFTVYGRNDITLTINSLAIDSAGATLKGNIAKDGTHLELIDPTISTTGGAAMFDMKEEGKENTFTLSVPSSMLTVNGAVSIKSASKESLSYGLRIYAMQNSFAARLNGEVKIEKTEPITISAPSSFQTIDELMQGFGLLVGSGASSPAEVTE